MDCKPRLRFEPFLFRSLGVPLTRKRCLSIKRLERGATRIFENRLIWPIWVPRSEGFCARHKGLHGAAAFLTFLGLLARESGTGQRSCRPSRGVDANCSSVGCRRCRRAQPVPSASPCTPLPHIGGRRCNYFWEP